MTRELQNIFDTYFKFLIEDFGFVVDSSRYEPAIFGNFIIELSKGQKKIKIVSDRSQIFIDIFDPKVGWRNKDDILEDKGIMRTRFETKNGLWVGFEIQNQSLELKTNRSLLNI